MQVKTTVRYHLALVGMAILSKSTNTTCWRGCGKKGGLLHCWWECRLVQPLWKTVWRGLRKMNIELPWDPANATGHISRQNHNSKRYTHQDIHYSTIPNSQNMETASMFIYNEWIEKMWYIYTMDYYSAIEKNKIIPFAATWMEHKLLLSLFYYY